MSQDRSFRPPRQFLPVAKTHVWVVNFALDGNIMRSEIVDCTDPENKKLRKFEIEIDPKTQAGELKTIEKTFFECICGEMLKLKRDEV